MTRTVLPTKPVFMLKTCKHCKGEFSTNRSKAVYCSSRCRTLAWRDRHSIQTKQDREYTTCQREECTNTIPSHTKVTSRYCSNACKQKVYHANHKEQEKAKRDEIRKKRDVVKAEKTSAEIADEFIQELMG